MLVGSSHKSCVTTQATAARETINGRWIKGHKYKPHQPILTGNPAGSFIATNSFNLLKCLNGATTSNTFRMLKIMQEKC